ncbi:MAG: outer membrane beta-barrel protein [Terracidiphilus sp.]|jgi:opacity protein-like surface antigen
MRTTLIRNVFLMIGTAGLIGGAAHAQTDLSASLYGAFTGTSNGNGTVQSPSNAAGFLLDVRHIRNPIIGYEATYSFNRANQKYASNLNNCPVGGILPCPPPPVSVGANAHEITGDWVASVKIANLRPFALAGAGLLFDAPVSGQASTSSTTKPVFVYGAGVDWGLLPHIGLRLQYRGNLYKAPGLTTLFTSTGAFTHTAEPMIGVYLRL